MTQVTVQQILPLTTRAKEVFALSLYAQQPLDYQAGDWALVSAHNPKALVESILSQLHLSGDEIIDFGRRLGECATHQALSVSLEITQLNPAILNKLQRQYQIGEFADRQAMIEYAQGRDILDLLNDFPELTQMGAEFLTLLSPLAPRYYSIASAGENPHQLDLVFRKAHYLSQQRWRTGVVSGYLSHLSVGDRFSLELRANPLFKLPADAQTPIVMLGAGTGIAPFIGFIEQRLKQGAQHNWLLFGESYWDNYQALFQTWQENESLQIDIALSRESDQLDQFAWHQGYITDVLGNKREQLWQQWQSGAVIYICGSQTRLASSAESLLCELFENKLNIDKTQAQQYWQSMRKERRIQMDVY